MSEVFDYVKNRDNSLGLAFLILATKHIDEIKGKPFVIDLKINGHEVQFSDFITRWMECYKNSVEEKAGEMLDELLSERAGEIMDVFNGFESELKEFVAKQKDYFKGKFKHE